MGTHTKNELAALGLLEEGLEAAHARTPGVWPGRAAVTQAHLEMLDLQGRVRKASAEPSPTDDDDRVAWAPVLLVGVLVLLTITAVLWLAG